MRRLIALLIALVATLPATTVAPAGAQVQGSSQPGEDGPRGLVYSGIRRSAPTGACRGNFELTFRDRVKGRPAQILCTHGPDPAPEGLDVRQDRDPQAVMATASPGTVAADAPTVPCYGNGVDGFRVQLIYARSATAADRFDSFAPSFVAAAARVDEVANLSAAETGGTRHVRFVTNASCQPVIDRVVLSSNAMTNFDATVSELRALGYGRTDRKYLLWADANTYCGIAQVYYDDSATTVPGANASNGHPGVPGEVARVDNGCWARTYSVEAHELMHNLGGVQASAPNATPYSHCTDEADRMCYADGSVAAWAIRQVCPASHEALFDCNHDDYYSTSPPAGSYLATHWNTASSAFLTSAVPTGGSPTTTAPPTTTTTTTAPPTTTTPTTAPPTTTTTTTAPPTTTTTTTAPPTTTTTTTAPPPAGTKPSAPQSLYATQPSSGAGVVLRWQAPASGTVTGYRIYRSTSPFALGLLASIGSGTEYADTSAAQGVLYYYSVAAINTAGEGPSSNLTGMVGR